jgi:hypothetical protein
VFSNSLSDLSSQWEVRLKRGATFPKFIDEFKQVEIIDDRTVRLWTESDELLWRYLSPSSVRRVRMVE